LSGELELANIDADHLKKVLNLMDNCPEGFRIVSNT
jgi:hypothetical protein